MMLNHIRTSTAPRQRSVNVNLLPINLPTDFGGQNLMFNGSIILKAQIALDQLLDSRVANAKILVHRAFSNS